MPPPMELRNRPQDGISWVQKVAVVEIGFRGAPGCFRGMCTDFEIKKTAATDVLKSELANANTIADKKALYDS